jgi:hypothetical protein
MNRRSFFRGAFLAAAGVILSPVVSLSKPWEPEPPIFRYKYSADRRTLVPNPEWFNAPYEVAFLIKHNAGKPYANAPLPLRFNDFKSARYYMDRVPHKFY